MDSVATDGFHRRLDELQQEITRLQQAISRLEIETAQSAQAYARRDLLDERLAATAALMAERLAVIHTRLGAHDHEITEIQRDARDRENRAMARDTARRNIVYAGLVAGIVGLAGAAIQAGVLG